MSLRGFRQVFSVIFALIVGAIGLILGQSLRWPAIWGLPAFADLAQQIPFYRPFTIAAMSVIGVLLGVVVGPKLADRLVALGNAIDRLSTRDKVAVVVGTLIGLGITTPFIMLLAKSPAVGLPVSTLLCIAFVYLGIRATLGMKDDFSFVGRSRAIEPVDVLPERCKLLDTNVIIDGRIADICKAGFVDGTIYVPGFVLDELQHIADSSDSLKRARGRRGLDILNAMQKELPLVVRSLDHKLGLAASSGEVDSRLVSLAKVLAGSIVTNDFNLNKVAALQGVTVLNVNELANALKPVVLPGEEMRVSVIREGKEQNQGIAYLDDGTMIVIEDGRRAIGDSVDVTVTSVLQTLAGKMIFARLKDSTVEWEESHESGRSRAGSGARFKTRP